MDQDDEDKLKDLFLYFLLKVSPQNTSLSGSYLVSFFFFFGSQ